jgi:hypothetical protein
VRRFYGEARFSSSVDRDNLSRRPRQIGAIHVRILSPVCALAEERFSQWK